MLRPALHRSASVRALVLAAATLGCSRERGASTSSSGVGTIVIAAAADADHLFPPLVVGTQGKQVVDLVYDYLADPPENLNTIGDSGFTPRLARRWTWAKDSLSIAFQLDPRARWHDGQRVTASDVRFTFDLITDPVIASPRAASLANVDSVSVSDSVTAVLWFKHRAPEQFFEAVYNLAVVPEHVLGTIPRRDLPTSPVLRSPVGSGRFRFVRWDAGYRIELVADTANWRGRPKLDRVIWSITGDPASLVTGLASGEADFTDLVRGEALKQVSSVPSLRVVPYPSLEYGYLGFNLRDPDHPGRPHPLFGDRALRRALSMAVDRRAMIRNVADTLGYPALGPLTRAQATADTTMPALPYDPAAASRSLDSLGWRDTDGDGVRDRGGRPLAFEMIVPTSSAVRMQMSVLLHEQFRRIGADVRIRSMDMSAFYDRATRGRFDTMLNAWHADPSPSSIRDAWATAAAIPSGANFVSYRNAAFDALVDSAAAEFDPARSRALFRRAYEKIIDDAPAIWLYELRLTAAAHRRLRITGMRADAWWAGLPEWSIAPGERTPRDALGIRTASR